MYFVCRLAAVAVFSASVLGAVIDRRTTEQIQAGIPDLQTKVQMLDSQVVAFPNSGGSLLTALAIHTAATNVGTSLKSLTTATGATPALTDAEGQIILSQLQILQPNITDVLQHVVDKKPASMGFIWVAYQASSGLISPRYIRIPFHLRSVRMHRQEAMTIITPASLATAANAVIMVINTAFDNATAVHSEVNIPVLAFAFLCSVWSRTFHKLSAEIVSVEDALGHTVPSQMGFVAAGILLVKHERFVLIVLAVFR
ncbi:hydrophobic surface binding protein A-domain-containing protein [Auriculariales sp. MPI-PUGE-AT-0066]|nr:hydrophobic surface binding protein A-domain-containing protein [Auriculariales sp. MPI-PUGE-AT-0066]